MTISEKFTRRLLLKSAAAGVALLAACSMPVFAQSKTKLVFIEPFDLTLEYLQEMNAVVGGHFENEGLEVEITNVRGTSVGIQQVIAGQANFTRVGLLDLFKASASQDTNLISVGTSLQGGIFSLISRSGDPINSPADLRGKTVGIASLGGGQENILNLMLAGAGVPPSEVERQAIGSSAGNVEILKQGRVDAFISNVETALILEMNDEPVEIWSTTQFAPLPGGVIATTEKFATENPEVMVKFVRAMRNSALEILSSDPGEILDRITPHYDIVVNDDRDFRIAAIKAYNDLTLDQGEENVMRNVPSVFEESARLIEAADIMQVDDVSALYSNTYYDGAVE